MMTAHTYHNIYLLIVSILTMIAVHSYRNKDSFSLGINLYDGLIPTFLLCFFMVLFIGMRPMGFGDMPQYAMSYESLLGRPFNFNWDVTNKLFDNFVPLIASLGISTMGFFIICAFLYIGSSTFACIKLFPKDSIMGLLVWLGSFSTFSYGTNGIKAGMAASLFLIAIAMNDRGNKIWTIFSLLLSWGFHHSMVLPIVAFIICKLIKNPKYYLWFWLFGVIIAALHFKGFQYFFAGLSDEGGANYLLGDEETVKTSILGGFRIDFILYSVVPIVIGVIAKRKRIVCSDCYYFILNIYTFINSIWMLCMYAEFTNRIAFLSWLLYPIVLIYPFIREDWGETKYRTLSLVSVGSLCFTLFMNYIYY